LNTIYICPHYVERFQSLGVIIIWNTIFAFMPLMYRVNCMCTCTDILVLITSIYTVCKGVLPVCLSDSIP